MLLGAGVVKQSDPGYTAHFEIQWFRAAHKASAFFFDEQHLIMNEKRALLDLSHISSRLPVSDRNASR